VDGGVRGALRALGLVALALVVLPATPMCALPRVRGSGAAVAQLSTGPLCAEVAHDVRVSREKVEFNGGGDCRFCPEEVAVSTSQRAPSLAAEWGLVGFTPVARRLEKTGCGGSGCEYALTAWWWQGGGWVVVTGRDGETDELFGAGPPFDATWGAVAASCSGRSADR